MRIIRHASAHECGRHCSAAALRHGNARTVRAAARSRRSSSACSGAPNARAMAAGYGDCATANGAAPYARGEKRLV